MDVIHVMLKREENMVNSRATPLKQMTTYEWCMKVSVMLPPPPPFLAKDTIKRV